MSTVVVIHSGELGELLAAQFDRYGLPAYWSRSLADAGNYIFDNGSRLVVVDLTLPGGLEFAEAVKRTRSLPVIGLHPPGFIESAEHKDRPARVGALSAHFATPFRSLAVIEEAARLLGAPLADVPPATRVDAESTTDVETTDPSGSVPLASMPSEPSAERKTIEGEIRAGTVQNLLDAFHHSQTTGELWLESEAGRFALLFVRGDIVGARTTERTDSLGTIASDFGLIPAAIMDDAKALVDAGKAPHLIAALLQHPDVSSDALRRLVDLRARRVAYRVVGMRRGRYTVTSQRHGLSEPLPTSLSVAEAILRGTLASEPLAVFEQNAPDDARFAPAVEAPYTLDELRLTIDEARFVIAMDGTKTMADLELLNERLDRRSQVGLTTGLLRLGLVKLVGRGAAEPRKISFF